MHFEPINLKWLLVLLMAVFTAIVSAIAPVSLAEDAKPSPRAHHPSKTWNEALAKHQLAYSGYFFTLVFAARFPPQTLVWMQSFMQAGIIFAFFFWFFSIKSLVKQEFKIASFHSHGRSPAACNAALTFWDFIRLCWVKLLTTAILLAMSFCAATYAIPN